VKLLDETCYTIKEELLLIRSSYLIKGQILFLGALISVLLSPQVTATKIQDTPAYKITAIKALLFYDTSGKFSRDVLGKPEFTFWNTIIGEGDAEAPSSSTLVLIEVTNKSRSENPAAARKVEFVATAAGKIVLRRTADVGLFSEAGRFYAPFWLYDTGCSPIKISARIIGQSEPSSMTRTIPFKCGE